MKPEDVAEAARQIICAMHPARHETSVVVTVRWHAAIVHCDQ